MSLRTWNSLEKLVMRFVIAYSLTPLGIFQVNASTGTMKSMSPFSQLQHYNELLSAYSSSSWPSSLFRLIYQVNGIHLPSVLRGQAMPSTAVMLPLNSLCHLLWIHHSHLLLFSIIRRKEKWTLRRNVLSISRGFIVSSFRRVTEKSSFFIVAAMGQ